MFSLSDICYDSLGAQATGGLHLETQRTPNKKISYKVKVNSMLNQLPPRCKHKYLTTVYQNVKAKVHSLRSLSDDILISAADVVSFLLSIEGEVCIVRPKNNFCNCNCTFRSRDLFPYSPYSEATDGFGRFNSFLVPRLRNVRRLHVCFDACCSVDRRKTPELFMRRWMFRRPAEGKPAHWELALLSTIQQGSLRTLKLNCGYDYSNDSPFPISDKLHSVFSYELLNDLKLYCTTLSQDDTEKLKQLVKLNTLGLYKCKVDVVVLSSVICKDNLRELNNFYCDDILEVCKISHCHPEAACIKSLQLIPDAYYYPVIQLAEDLSVNLLLILGVEAQLLDLERAFDSSTLMCTVSANFPTLCKLGVPLSIATALISGVEVRSVVIRHDLVTVFTDNDMELVCDLLHAAHPLLQLTLHCRSLSDIQIRQMLALNNIPDLIITRKRGMGDISALTTDFPSTHFTELLF